MSDDRVKWSVYRVEGTEELFAVLPDDGTNGLFVGDYLDLCNLRDQLEATTSSPPKYLLTIQTDDERLGNEWLTIREAAIQYGIPATTLRSACQFKGMKGAKKNAWNEWTFSRMAFYRWYNRYKEESRGKR